MNPQTVLLLLLGVALLIGWAAYHHKRREVSRFAIAIGGTNMNLQIFDDGKGVKFTAVPDHPLKTGEVPVWSVSDPTALAVAPDPNDASGLTAIGTIPVPAKDATGLVVTITLMRADGKTITDDAPPIDIVPDPNAEVGSFVIQESVL